MSVINTFQMLLCVIAKARSCSDEKGNFLRTHVKMCGFICRSKDDSGYIWIIMTDICYLKLWRAAGVKKCLGGKRDE